MGVHSSLSCVGFTLSGTEIKWHTIFSEIYHHFSYKYDRNSLPDQSVCHQTERRISLLRPNAAEPWNVFLSYICTYAQNALLRTSTSPVTLTSCGLQIYEKWKEWLFSMTTNANITIICLRLWVYVFLPSSLSAPSIYFRQRAALYETVHHHHHHHHHHRADKEHTSDFCTVNNPTYRDFRGSFL
jgi:hypothetical protein